LSAFDKDLLGRKVPASVTRGWRNLDYFREGFLGKIDARGIKALAPGQSLDHAQLVYLAKYVDKGEPGYLEPAPGFYKDWLFAQEPTYRRLQLLKPIKESPHKAEWQTVFSEANYLGKYLKSGTYSKTELRDAWRRYVKSPEFQGWLDGQSALDGHPPARKGFRTEVDHYSPDLLSSLLN